MSRSTLYESLYDHPKYYDLAFRAESLKETRFLIGCFHRFVRFRVQSVFEPACGTGRVLLKLAKSNFTVGGNDINPHAINYCRTRFKRHRLNARLAIADMRNFHLSYAVDSAFNLVNTVRHLPTQAAFEAHLHAVAQTLRKDGVYILGLHLVPKRYRWRGLVDAWHVQHGRLRLKVAQQTIALNLDTRRERIQSTIDIIRPLKRQRLIDEFDLRTYSLDQLSSSLHRLKLFDWVASYDFNYVLESPIEVNHQTEDLVLVLRKK